MTLKGEISFVASICKLNVNCQAVRDVPVSENAVTYTFAYVIKASSIYSVYVFCSLSYPDMTQISEADGSGASKMPMNVLRSLLK